MHKVLLHPDEASEGHSFDRLFSRVIVGPTLHPDILTDRLIARVAAKKLTEPGRLVVVSGIPLRQWS